MGIRVTREAGTYPERAGDTLGVYQFDRVPKSGFSASFTSRSTSPLHFLSSSFVPLSCVEPCHRPPLLLWTVWLSRKTRIRSKELDSKPLPHPSTRVRTRGLESTTTPKDCEGLERRPVRRIPIHGDLFFGSLNRAIRGVRVLSGCLD